MQKEFKKRSVAIRVYINEIINSEFIEEDDRRRVLTTSGLDISRIAVMGLITYIYTFEEGIGNTLSKPFASITIEDGTGSIRCKVWGEETKRIANLNKGDFVHIIGRPRIYNEEKYINPEIIQKIDDINLIIFHEAQVLRRKIKEQEYSKPRVMTRIVNFIKNNNKGTGVPLAAIKKAFNEVPEKILKNALLDLLNNGDIYEYMKNVYKYVEG